MAPFVDRDTVLAWLAEGRHSGQPQCRILFGRRRAGTPALLDRFAHWFCREGVDDHDPCTLGKPGSPSMLRRFTSAR